MVDLPSPLLRQATGPPAVDVVPPAVDVVPPAVDVVPPAVDVVPPAVALAPALELCVWLGSPLQAANVQLRMETHIGAMARFQLIERSVTGAPPVRDEIG